VSTIYNTHKRVLLDLPPGTPLCAKCKGPHERIGQRLCRDCHNAYQRGWKQKQARDAKAFRETFHMKQTVTGETEQGDAI
jgi:predicted amidophosphoribosyltransferase